MADYDSHSYLVEYLDYSFMQTPAGQLSVEFLERMDSGEIETVRDAVSNINGSPAQELSAAIGEELQRLELLATNVLRQINPSSAFDYAALVGTAKSIRGARILEMVGLDRFTWSIGAAGGQTDAPIGAYCARYFGLASKWVATEELRGIIRAAAGSAGVDDLEAPLNSVRAVPLTAKFRWGSLEVARELIEQAAIEDISVELIDEVVNYLSAYDGYISGVLNAEPRPRGKLWEFFNWSAVPMGYYAGHQFLDLMTTIDLSMRPFIADNRGAVAPAALATINTAVHIPLFRYLKQASSDSHMSVAFEGVCGSVLQTLCGDGFRALPAPIRAAELPGNPGEIDFAVTDLSTLLFVGEAKCRHEAKDPFRVRELFSKQINKATEQVDIRVHALRSGSRLMYADNEVDGFNLGATGIVVTLHDYGGAIRNAVALDKVGTGVSHAPVLSITDLVMLKHTLNGAVELSEYIDFRQNILYGGSPILDEIDVVSTYLGSAKRSMAVLDLIRGLSQFTGIVNPRDVPAPLQLRTDPPNGAQWWRDVVENLPLVGVPTHAKFPRSDRETTTDANEAVVDTLEGQEALLQFPRRPKVVPATINGSPFIVLQIAPPRNLTETHEQAAALGGLRSLGFVALRRWEDGPLPLLERLVFAVWPSRLYLGGRVGHELRKLVFQRFPADLEWYQRVHMSQSQLLGIAVLTLPIDSTIQISDLQEAMAAGTLLAAAVSGVCQ